MVGQMNAVRRQNRPGGLRRRGVTGHSPALARLFLVGLRPRRAQRRFTGQNQYRTREEHAERTTVASALPAGKRPSPAVASLRCHLDSALVPSVKLIETALAARDGRKACSVSGRTMRGVSPSRIDPAGCRERQTDSRRDVLGCRRTRKERRDNLETQTVTSRRSANAVPTMRFPNTPTEEAPAGFPKDTTQKNPPRGP
jgi:hypothetical protein